MALNLRSIGNALRGALRFLDTAGAGKPGGSAPAPARLPARQTRPGKPAAKPRKPSAKPGGPAAKPGVPAASPDGRNGPGSGAAGLAGTYPGDFRGTAAVRYAPSPNGRPEPGEIVWTWVPYEEDHSQGKDRPVLLVGSSGRHLLGLMLTSKDHDADSRSSDDYVDIGTGLWDRQRRPSEARLDRVLQIRPQDVRREGAILDAGRFGAIASALRERHGWT